MNNDTALWLALGSAILAVIYGLVTTKWVLAKPAGNERMQEIAAAVQEGAKAYMNRQYSTIGLVGVILFVVVGFFLDWATAIGFAIGFDRLTELTGLKADQFYRTPDIFVAALGAKSRRQAFEWVCALGDKGINAELDFATKSLKSQMKRADRLAAGHVLIVGDDELKKGAAILRNMETKEQVSVPIEGLVETVKGKIIKK